MPVFKDIALRKMEIEKRLAKDRQGERHDLEHGGTVPQGSQGKARDRVGEALAKSELTSIAHKLMVIQKRLAKDRQSTTQAKPGEGKAGSGTVPEPEQGQARDKVGQALGVSGKTAGKLADIGEAAERLSLKSPSTKQNQVGRVGG